MGRGGDERRAKEGKFAKRIVLRFQEKYGIEERTSNMPRRRVPGRCYLEEDGEKRGT